MALNWADWTIIAIILISCLISLKRGFVKEALSLVIWVLAFTLAILFSPKLSVILPESITSPSVREMVAFGILFALTLIVGAMVNHLLAELIRATGLSGTDRLFGMVFGLARGIIVVLALLLLLPFVLPVQKDSWWQQSQLIPQFLMLEGWSKQSAETIINWFSSFFEE